MTDNNQAGDETVSPETARLIHAALTRAALTGFVAGLGTAFALVWLGILFR